MTVHLNPGKPAGILRVPPSKSMAHRMLFCASLARGASRVSNLDYSVDISTTIGALRQLGANIVTKEHEAEVEGLPGGFATITKPVNCAESGSTLRFLIPLYSLTGQTITFTGAPRLFARPLSVYQQIFSSQGLAFEATADSLVIRGALRSGDFTLPGNVSSQFISGLLFALPLLKEDSNIRIIPPFESYSYVELTRSAQKLFGVKSTWTDDLTLYIPGGQLYKNATVAVEGDWSQAVVPAVLAAVRGGVETTGLAPNSVQGDRVVLEILRRCGAEVKWADGHLLVTSAPGGAASGGINSTFSPAAKTPVQNGLTSPGEVDLSDCPDLGPVLCALALFCKGTTTFINAGRLRTKESDRIATMQAELRKLGGNITSGRDTITVEGGHPLRGGQVAESHNDHRVVMALAVAALCGGVDLTIEGAEAVRKSWPGFFDDLARLGVTMERTGEA